MVGLAEELFLLFVGLLIEPCRCSKRGGRWKPYYRQPPPPRNRGNSGHSITTAVCTGSGLLRSARVLASRPVWQQQAVSRHLLSRPVDSSRQCRAICSRASAVLVRLCVRGQGTNGRPLDCCEASLFSAVTQKHYIRTYSSMSEENNRGLLRWPMINRLYSLASSLLLSSDYDHALKIGGRTT